ncbi:B12-binding domain-containing radical SAM protein [Flavobacterium pallidum]|uniref:Radical SAM protein n=1 Tax=Flavobacterium pallidum TaxID=2172098 RepID=A0A2S1SGA0_9FLAO|nr:radical SAM protein [Flavobacterium pallidum]AWI25367.1 radical SAM protein [Flavobacterium pallidum]
MSEILFTHSYFYRRDPKQWKNKMPFPPLGTLYAASLMRGNGYNVHLFDTCLIEDPLEIRPAIEAILPKYLVIYDDGFNYLTKMCLTTMREAAFEMIAMGKQNGAIVIVSSSDSTDHYGLYLEKGADYIIQGEGELTLLELINTLEKNQIPETTNGIAFRKHNDIQVNPKRPVLQNLDELPLPAWDLIEMNDYKIIWSQSGQDFTLNIATTRGCPYKCNWCAKPIYGNRYNSHSPEYIVNHIEFLRQSFGVKRFWMCDDIFGLKPNWVQQFNAGLKSKKLKIRYYIQSRADLLLKEDTIDALAESGLEEVWVGAESASQKILDAMDKGTKVEQIYEATRLLKSKNIRIAFFLQFGYPGETPEDIEHTISMVKELKPDNIGISVSYPLPGTPFYEKVKADLTAKSNWKDSDDLEMMFNGTFKSAYYKKLQRFVHKEFRKTQGLDNLKAMAGNPLELSLRKVISVMKLGYYVPGAFASGISLKKMQK